MDTILLPEPERVSLNEVKGYNMTQHIIINIRSNYMDNMGSTPEKKKNPDRPTLQILGLLVETHHLFFSAQS